MYRDHIGQAAGLMVKRVAGQAEGVHELSEEARWEVAGRTSDRAWVGGVAVTEPRDEDQVRGGKGKPNRKKYEGGRTETRSRLFDDADRTEQCSKEIVQYQGAEPPGPLLRR